MKRSPGGATVQSLVYRQSPVAASVVLAARRPVPLPPAAVCVCVCVMSPVVAVLGNLTRVIRSSRPPSLSVTSQPRCVTVWGRVAIGVNSHWTQGLKPPPTFMIMGLAYMTSPHFCDVMCFSCSHWFYAMPTNRQSDHSFTAGKGLNLPAPLDIQ